MGRTKATDFYPLERLWDFRGGLKSNFHCLFPHNATLRLNGLPLVCNDNCQNRKTEVRFKKTT